MYSRFLIWQPEEYISSQVESGEENTFITNDPITDIHFSLKAYGWKKAGETNRIILHFGTYKCYYRKVGDSNFTLFAFGISERGATEDIVIYKDINVTTGKIEFARYEIKIVAERLEQLENWAGGLVEGIASGDRFYFNVYTRKLRPLQISIAEAISLTDSIEAPGLTPLPLFVVEPFVIEITDTLTDAFVGYLIGLDPPIFEIITIQETIALITIIEGVAVGLDFIDIEELVNIVFTIDLDIDLFEEVNVDNDLPNAGGPITNESPLRLGMVLFEPEFVETWGALTNWTVSEGGGATVSVSGNILTVDKPGFFDSASLERTFLPADDQEKRYSMCEFFVKINNSYTQMELTIGERFKARLQQGKILFEGNQEVAGLNLGQWTKIRIESMKSNEFQTNHFREVIDVFIEGLYVNRTYCDKPALSDKIYITLTNIPPSTFGTNFQMGKFEVGLIGVHNPNIIPLSRVDAITYTGDTLTKDVSVEDILTDIEVVELPHGTAIVIEYVSAITEFVDLDLQPVIEDVFDEIIIVEALAEVNIERSRQVFDEITITDFIESVSVVNFGDIVVDDNIYIEDIASDMVVWLLAFQDDFDDLSEWNVTEDVYGVVDIDPAGQVRMRNTNFQTFPHSKAIISHSLSGEIPANAYNGILTANIKLDSIGEDAVWDHLDIQFATGLSVAYTVKLGSEAIRMGDTTIANDVFSDAGWHELQIRVDTGHNANFGMVSVWVDGDLIGTGTHFLGAAQTIRFILYGHTQTTEIHMDDIFIISDANLIAIAIFVAEDDTNDYSYIDITESLDLDISSDIFEFDPISITEFADYSFTPLFIDLEDSISITEFADRSLNILLSLFYEDINVVEDLEMRREFSLFYDSCDSLTAWTTKIGNMEVSPAGQFRFYPTSGDIAIIARTESAPNLEISQYTFEVRMKIDSLGSIDEGDLTDTLKIQFGGAERIWIGGDGYKIGGIDYFRTMPTEFFTLRMEIQSSNVIPGGTSTQGNIIVYEDDVLIAQEAITDTDNPLHMNFTLNAQSQDSEVHIDWIDWYSLAIDGEKPIYQYEEIVDVAEVVTMALVYPPPTPIFEYEDIFILEFAGIDFLVTHEAIINDLISVTDEGEINVIAGYWDEDGSSLTNWSVTQSDPSVVEISPAGQIHVWNKNAGGLANISRTLIPFTDKITNMVFEMRIKIDQIGDNNIGGSNYGILAFRTGSNNESLTMSDEHWTVGSYISESNWERVEFPHSTIIGEFFTLKFVISDGTLGELVTHGAVDIYENDILLVSAPIDRHNSPTFLSLLPDPQHVDVEYHLDWAKCYTMSEKFGPDIHNGYGASHVTVEESVSINFSTVFHILGIDETVTIVENVSVIFEWLANVYDEVLITENVSLSLFLSLLEVDISDAISIVENASAEFTAPIEVFVFDTLGTISEYVMYDWWHEMASASNPGTLALTIGIGATLEFDNPSGQIHCLVPTSADSGSTYFQANYDANESDFDHQFDFKGAWEVEFRLKITQGSSPFGFQCENLFMDEFFLWENDGLTMWDGNLTIDNAWTEDAWHVWKFVFGASKWGSGHTLVDVYRDGVFLGQGSSSSNANYVNSRMWFWTDRNASENREWYMDWVRMRRLMVLEDEPIVEFQNITVTESVTLSVI